MRFLSDILAKAGLIVDGAAVFNSSATGQTPASNDDSTKFATTAWVRTFVQPYTLPIASASVLGGIKVGSGLAIDAITGVLSVSGGGVSIKSTQTFIATAGQTVFTITNGYTPGLIDVFLNGIYLSPGQTTATDGNTVVFGDPASAGDIIDVIVTSPIVNGSVANTDNLPEGLTNLYYTNTRARLAISLTTTGTSGAATYNSSTGIFNIPNYQGLVPANGIAGQILAKASATSYDTTWIDNYTSQVKHLVKLGEAMSAGTPVYVPLAQDAGTNMTVMKASNTTEGMSSKTIGLIATGGNAGDFVYVFTEGLLEGLNTSTATKGDPVWLGANGTLIFGLVNKPVAPNHLVFLGIVTRSQTNNGEIFVKVQNGFELDELHNLSVANASDGDMIKYVASTGLWTKIAATTTNISEGVNLYYTQGRFDTAFAAKSTTNLSEGTNLYYTDARVLAYLGANNYATQSYVATQIANLVASAPAALDTLNELATALGNDASFSTTVSTALGNRLRVDIDTQGLTSTQQGYGRTNLGLGSLATLSSVGNGYITDVAWSKLTGVPSTFTPAAHTHVWTDITDRPTNLSAFTNGPGYLTGITSGQVTAALGYTPYNSSNPSGYITSSGNISGYAMSLNGFSQQTEYTILTGPANGPVWKVRYDGATANRYIDFGFKDGNNVYYEGFKIYNNGTPTWAGNTILHAGNVGSYSLPIGGGTLLGNVSYNGYALSTSSYNIAHILGNWNGSGYWGMGSNGTHTIRIDQVNSLSGQQAFASASDVQLDLGTNRVLHAGNYSSYALPLTGGNLSGGITFTSAGGSVLLKHAVSEVDAWIFQENANNWGLYWKNAPTGHHTFGGYTSVGAELVGMSAANSSGNGVLTSNFVGATTAYAQWMISNYTGYIWSASTIYAVTSMVVGGNTVLHAGNYNSYAMAGAGYSANQNLNTSDGPTFNNLYNNGWFRNNNNLQGLYSQPNNQHFYANNQTEWNFTFNNAAQGGLLLRADHQSTVKAYLYYNASGSGLLTNSGNWGVRMNYDGGATPGGQLYGPWTTANLKIYPVSESWAEGISFIMPTTSTWGGLRWQRQRANNDGNFALGYVGYSSSDDLVFIANNAGTQINDILRMTKTGLVSMQQAPDGATLILGGVDLSRVYSDSNRNSLVINAPYYPHLYINATAGDTTNPTHGPVISMTGRLSSGGFRRWGMGIGNYDPGYFSIGWYDNNTNPHYGTGHNWPGAGGRFVIDTSGNIWCTGDITAYGAQSDIRLKTIKEKVPNALEGVLKLNGYRFDWKERDVKITTFVEDIGVVAQEVADVFPELARTGEDGWMSVRYQGLTAVLIEAVKEQQTQIKDQQSEISELKDLVKQLLSK